MKTTTQWLALASITALCLSGNVFAQEEGAPPAADRGDRGGRGPGGFGGFGGDPAQFREQMEQRMMEATRERLEIKDDAEWNVIQPLIKKVNDLRTQQMASGMRGMFGRGRGPGGDRGGDSGRGGGLFGEPSAEQTALSEAVDRDASKEDLKAKMEAFRKARDQKAAELKAAQDTLKRVLTTKQEAIALQLGLVN